ncbi:DUF916 domain-containing protein [Streptomyces virginiae]|uniref:WxL protein peptidoglycan domain-containing protein n=1 Tax=Streptomyces virginiae TaxID=1961 RepID=UPI002255D99C|nr:DUF916 domain-containing protein [Streptomyces virginiae]MCX4719369.1 DUF916 domain-containing protein [Streptomyces virginiae]
MATAALLGGIFLGGPAGTATADDGQWSVLPVANTVGQRPYFYLAAAPGRSVADAVTLTNRTDRPRTFRLYVADAYNTVRDGGFALRGPDEPRLTTAAWAKLDRDRVTVAARASVAVGFTLTVPDRAEPGDHPGAVVALEERPAAAADTGRGIGVQRAVAARLYLRVTGPTAPALTVRDVTVHRRGSGADISYTLHNIGNVTLRPRATLTATGALGRSLHAQRLGGLPAELLPGQEVRLGARWEGAPRAEWAEVTVRRACRAHACAPARRACHRLLTPGPTEPQLRAVRTSPSTPHSRPCRPSSP